MGADIKGGGSGTGWGEWYWVGGVLMDGGRRKGWRGVVLGGGSGTGWGEW